MFACVSEHNRNLRRGAICEARDYQTRASALNPPDLRVGILDVVWQLPRTIRNLGGGALSGQHDVADPITRGGHGHAVASVRGHHHDACNYTRQLAHITIRGKRRNCTRQLPPQAGPE